MQPARPVSSLEPDTKKNMTQRLEVMTDAECMFARLLYFRCITERRDGAIKPETHLCVCVTWLYLDNTPRFPLFLRGGDTLTYVTLVGTRRGARHEASNLCLVSCQCSVRMSGATKRRSNESRRRADDFIGKQPYVRPSRFFACTASP